jgi:3-oxoacyl-[acyl-carrier-protein] synthase-3
MAFASVGPIEIYLPEKIEDNDQLAAEFPKWDMDLIYSKTGIRARHIAAPDQCASDLGVAAAERLFKRHKVDPKTIDFLLFCTQSPD